MTAQPAPDATSDWTALPDSGLDEPAPAPVPHTTVDVALMEEYARLRRVQKAREAEAAAAKEAADALEAQLLDQMLQAGVPQITVGETLVYMHTSIKASKRGDVDPETFHAALREAGLEDFIKPTVSAQTLAAYARDLRDADVELPEPLHDVLNVIEITKLQTKKAAARRTRSGRAR